MFTFSYIYVNKQWKDKQETGYLRREGYELTENTWLEARFQFGNF